MLIVGLGLMALVAGRRRPVSAQAAKSPGTVRQPRPSTVRPPTNPPTGTIRKPPTQATRRPASSVKPASEPTPRPSPKPAPLPPMYGSRAPSLEHLRAKHVTSSEKAETASYVDGSPRPVSTDALDAGGGQALERKPTSML